MRTEKLRAVSVGSLEGKQEYYEAGKSGVTAIEWGEVCGYMAPLDTVRVFKGGKLYSEHPFSNCWGVFFAADDGDGEMTTPNARVILPADATEEMMLAGMASAALSALGLEVEG